MSAIANGLKINFKNTCGNIFFERAMNMRLLFFTIRMNKMNIR